MDRTKYVDKSLFHFPQHVLKDGYQLAYTVEAKPQLVLVVGSSSMSEGVVQDFCVKGFGYESLYRQFASLSGSPNSIVKFANIFGALGIERPCQTRDQTGLDLRTVWVEDLSAWKQAIEDITAAVRIIDVCRLGSVSEANKLVQWHHLEDGSGKFPIVPLLSGRSKQSRSLDPLEELGWTNARHNPKVLLAELSNLVNEKLAEHASSKIGFHGGKKVWYLYFSPKNLLGFLWLQVARAMTEEGETRECRHCRKIFEVAPSAGRKSKVFCSTVCRVADYRNRQATAQVMQKQGKSVATIAKKLGTTSDTVRKWIGAK